MLCIRDFYGLSYLLFEGQRSLLLFVITPHEIYLETNICKYLANAVSYDALKYQLLACNVVMRKLEKSYLPTKIFLFNSQQKQILFGLSEQLEYRSLSAQSICVEIDTARQA